MVLTHPVSFFLRQFFFLSLFFLFDLLLLLSFDESDFFDYESGNDGSGSGSPGTCTFPFCSVISVGCVSGVGSGFFFSTRIESICDIVLLFVFVPRVVDS